MNHQRFLITAILGSFLWISMAAAEQAVNHTTIVAPMVKFGGDLMASLENVALEMLRRDGQNRELLMEIAGEARGLMMYQYRGGAEFAGTNYLPLDEVDEIVSEAFWRLDGPEVFKVIIGPKGEARLIQSPNSLVLARGQHAAVPLIIQNQMQQQASLIFASWPGLPTMQGQRQPIGIPRDSTRGYLLSLVSNQPGRRPAELRLQVGDRPVQVPVELEVKDVGRLRVRLLDHEGKPTAARCYLRGADGLVRAPRDSWERIGEMSGEYFFYGDGTFELELPEGDTTLEVVKGFEYQPVKRGISIQAGKLQEVEVRLDLGQDMAAQGWYSGDAHFHANSSGHPTATPKDVMLHLRGENVNVGNVLISNSLGSWVLDEQYLEGRLNPLSTEKHLLSWGEEIRSHKLYGHMALLNLKQPVEPLYTGWPGTRYPEDYPPHHFHAVKAHEQGAVVTYVHLGYTDPNSLDGARAHELPVDLALGQIDAVDVFSQHPEWPSLDLWYRLLNCGLKCPISAGTDASLNSKTAAIPGGSRVYVRTDGELTYESWLQNLKRGRTFATNGPLVEFRVDGKQPGEDLRLSSADPASLRVEVEARCLIAPMEKVEIVVNGRVVESIPAGQDKHHIRVDTTVSIDRSSWIAARVVGPPHRLVVTDEQVLAHTSPVYSYLGEQEISSPADALYFVNWIDDLIRKVEQHGVFSKLDHKYEIIQLFRKAQDIYARKAQAGN